MVGVGAQFKPISKLSLRIGYNYGNNPVKPHKNFVGGNPAPRRRHDYDQGTPIPTYYFETFRTIGFPAIVENHLTLGIGYDVTERFLSPGFMLRSKTASPPPAPIWPSAPSIKSTLSETGVDLGLSWRF